MEGKIPTCIQIISYCFRKKMRTPLKDLLILQLIKLNLCTHRHCCIYELFFTVL
jgi:hypothetical protein